MERMSLDQKNITGIMGGAGPEATGLLYKNIIDLARAKYNAHRLEEYPHLLIASTPILQDVTDNNELTEVIASLCDTADSLKAGGAKQLCFACNTHHLSIDTVRNHVGLPFISMVDLVQENVKRAGYKSVVVIGTSYTLNQSLYAEPLNRIGADMVELDKEYIEESHILIGDTLAGIPNELTARYIDLIKRITNKYSFDALLLGCTEYSVLEDRRKQNENNSFSIPIVDPLYELALAIDKIYYEKR
jgi:aspartate racemase